MSTEHTVRSFDEELKTLVKTVLRMGGLAEAQLANAVQALVRRDSDLAGRVVSSDGRIDAIEQEINDFAIRMLALRQPMADDLRGIVGALKISSDLERIGDYASNVGKRTLVLNQLAPVKPVTTIPTMARLVQDMVKDTLDAYVERDLDKAVMAWSRDDEVDELYTSLFRELVTYMMEDPRTITACTHLMFIAKNIERIGDHATNIAETVHYLVSGNPLRAARPKGSGQGEFGDTLDDIQEQNR
ncbi:phosphate transport system regulatory protein PhoU [Rhodospirillum rubrum]|uniref:phosphate signaling complex protein PhoU n=1 Tax=Rhodospirillum rubrum TaxID=1085 RepID=UPI0019041F68|nr:phosphate signaling complex protein PhoU [Rhodospirillum rubrum]MBK1664418.1 phosphate transport system regulatory protein PhoU [Rhodospirillum rubrum]MBK1675292.1 phosphate transport system regulatory protein PhoU [Rhodospirillum rubrum]